MRIRRNQLCPIHKSRTCCGREPVRKEKSVQVGDGALKTHITHGNIANSARLRKCENC